MDKIGLLGIVVFIGLGYLMSSHKKRIDWKTVAWGLGLQWIFAILILKGEWLASHLFYLPFPKGMGWVILGLMFAPTLYKKLTNKTLGNINWILLPVIFIGLIRGNLIGSAFDRMRVVLKASCLMPARALHLFLDLFNLRFTLFLPSLFCPSSSLLRACLLFCTTLALCSGW